MNVWYLIFLCGFLTFLRTGCRWEQFSERFAWLPRSAIGREFMHSGHLTSFDEAAKFVFVKRPECPAPKTNVISIIGHVAILEN